MPAVWEARVGLAFEVREVDVQVAVSVCVPGGEHDEDLKTW